MSVRLESQPTPPRVSLQTEDVTPPSPRTVSFATSPTRPPLLSDSEHVPHSFVWTDALEQRLTVVQSELKKSQRRWSESQDIWLEEEQNLQELKKRFKKQQKAEANVKKVALAWKRRTFRKPRSISSRKGSAASALGSDGEEEDDESEMEGRRKLTRTNTGSSFSKAIRRLSVGVVRSRTNTMPNSPTLQSRSGSHQRRASGSSSR